MNLKHEKLITSRYDDNDMLWTRGEKNIFWQVIKEHLLTLLRANNNHTAICEGLKTERIFQSLNPKCKTDLQKCFVRIKAYLWNGKYMKAIRLYLYINYFFTVLQTSKKDFRGMLIELQDVFTSPYIIAS